MTSKVCDYCHGRGILTEWAGTESARSIICPGCNGAGEVYTRTEKSEA